MNNEAEDALSRWWWPGQWLRIVYGVWIDQLWYWQNVRPRLRGRLRGWGIWTQGMLGAGLTAFAVVAIIGVVSSVAGIQVKWQFLFPTVAMGIVAGMVFGMLGLIIGITTSMVVGMAGCLCFGVLLGVLILRVGVNSDVILGTGQSATSLRLVGVGLIAVSAGLTRVLVEGRRWNLLESLLGAVFAGLVFGQMMRIGEGIAAAAIFILGIVAGERWATRQVPDDESRRRLANPDIQDPNGRRK